MVGLDCSWPPPPPYSKPSVLNALASLTRDMYFFGQIKQKQISIDLMEPVVMISSWSPTCEHGQALRGAVVLDLHQPTPYTSLTLIFKGVVRTLWPEGIGPRGTVVQHSHDLYESQTILLEAAPNVSTVLPAGKHRFPFEVPIPKNIVQTIETDYGKVKWTVTATLRRKGKLNTDLKSCREVMVLRFLPQSDLEEAESQHISITRDTPNQIVSYSMALEKHPLPLGSICPITFNIVPNTKHMRLDDIIVKVQETSVITCPELDGRRAHTTNIILKRVDNKPTHNLGIDMDAIGGVFNETIDFQLYNCTDGHAYTTLFDRISIRHWMTVTVRLSRPDDDASDKTKKSKVPKRITEECILESPIRLLSCRMVDNFMLLPQYKQVEGSFHLDGFLCPCDHEYDMFRQSGKDPRMLEAETYSDDMGVGKPLPLYLES
ncbi:hypothetical protein BZG36_02717 [Bifiguratus adelaidae]|uniref:Arrestin-like N-terminal domain-containing protein n=1 Tax=Bifiguratus adelaidae TaxID=1938954 RepID=A0A261Y1P1_9FUNG|nr:hypothetical protein BZG36_02717 [Bifiguratus adelaidae]